MNTYVVLDLETTGLDYTKEQITEIGAIKIDENYNEIDRFHTMVSLEEGRELSEFITKLTGITEKDLEGYPPENICLMELDEFIGDSIVVAQNAPFDLSFISRGGIEPEKFICTRALVRYVEPELSASLKDVTKRNGISLEGHHRALNDVLATIEVLRNYLPKAGEYYDPYNVVLDEPSRPLKFLPKYSQVRKVAHVALDYSEIYKLLDHTPYEVYRRFNDILNRMVKSQNT
ncbi:exonuclease domain-containing protein [Priestia megaterium]